MPRVIVDSDDDDVVSEVGGEDPIADHDGIFEYAEQEKANDVCADQHSVIHDTSASPERSGTRNDSCAGERKGNDRTQSTGSTERLIRDANCAITQPTPLPKKKRKAWHSLDGVDELALDQIDGAGQNASPSKDRTSKSRRAKTTTSNDDSTHKRQSKRQRKEDPERFDISSSSPTRADVGSGEAHGSQPVDEAHTIRHCSQQRTDSIITNASSDERRAREISRERNLSQSTRHSAQHLQNHTTPIESQSYHDSGNTEHSQDSAKTHVSVQAASTPERTSDTIVLLPDPPQSNAADSKRASRTRHAAVDSPRNSQPLNEITTSDEVAIGLPMEQYKPRPSRSRSHKSTEDNTGEAQDACETHVHSKSFEDGSKATKKTRSSTTGGIGREKSDSHRLRGGDRTMSDVTPSQKARKKESGDSVEAQIAGDVIILGEAPGTKSREPRRQVANDDDEDEDLTEQRFAASHEPANESVGDGLESQKNNDSGGDNAHQTSSNDEKLDALATTDVEHKGKKKGRGRPKKPKEPKASTELTSKHVESKGAEDVNETTFEPSQKTHSRSASTTESAQHNKENLNASVVRGTAQSKDCQSLEVVEDEYKDTKSQNASSDNKKTPESSLNGGSRSSPSKNSPLSSGRVPYRVGLSRRTNIQPLLRRVNR